MAQRGLLTALSAIRSANLTPTEHLLLSEFVNQAVDTERAARYVLYWIESSCQTVEEALRSLKHDWKRLVTRFTAAVEVPISMEALARHRDGFYCSMEQDKAEGVPAQVEPAHIISPTVFDTPDLETDGQLLPLMEAFLTPSKLSGLRDLLRDDSSQGMLKNLWILSPSFHVAFRQGRYVAIIPEPEAPDGLTFGDGSKFDSIVHLFTMSTKDPVVYSLPSRVLLRLHFRLAKSLHLFYIEDRIAEGWPSPPLITLNKPTKKMLRTLWHLVPKFIRINMYHLLSRIGRRIYGGNISPSVQRLPFGLYLKNCIRSQTNEENALKLVEKHTDVPAPLLVDRFEEEKEGTKTFIVMTRLRGEMLHTVFHRMSYPERERLSVDLRAVVDQLHRIPNRTPYLFASTTGEEIVDHRLGSCGPFNTEAEFNNRLVHKYVGPSTQALVAAAHAIRHRSCFTHSDLHPTNILIDSGRLSGIIDWECAAYQPEHWEFIKAIYGVWNGEAMEEVIRRAFGYRFEVELEAERELWKVTPFGI
ncbi:hypothetical protein EMCG_05802 [[Emmonsia] crescens]|uniref:Aminoglycoside phosphotransferase domain-containing protein n=1 Tax=[Emmonsia] crescens TaxID=73230 RepID=A0A0G2ID64_9EURO|nr:hypothetical protein EMCG_05802 [Emmonsia crescens UAMH 3008]